MCRRAVLVVALSLSLPLLSPGQASANRKMQAEFHNAYFKHQQMMVTNILPQLEPAADEAQPADDRRARRRAARLARFRGRSAANRKTLPTRYGGLEMLKQAKTVLTAMHADCAGKFKGITDDRLHADRAWSKWCQAAGRRDELLKALVVNGLRQHVAGIRDGFVTQSANLESSGGVLKDWDQHYYLNPKEAKAKILAQAKDDLAFVGVRDTGEIFAEADKALDELLTKIKAMVPRWKFTPEGTPQNDPFVAKTYKGTFKGIKINKMFVITKGWDVTKNALGVPVHRTRKGKIFYKLPSETWCRSDKWYYVQDYKGGKYGPSYVEHTPDKGVSGIVSCR